MKLFTNSIRYIKGNKKRKDIHKRHARTATLSDQY